MNQVAFITGASSGIGKTLAIYLKNKGYTVYGSSRNPDQYPTSEIPLLALDVRDPQSIKKAIAALIEQEGRIDVLINNAGVGITGALEEMPLNEIKNNFDTNFFGPIAMMQAVLPHMRSQNNGLIINITSIAGYMGLPYRGAYSASKGALELITEATRMETKPFGINLVTVAPGDFATDIAARRYHSPVNEDSPYYKWYKPQLDTINADVSKGANPMIMAEAIHKIMQKNTTKIHYKVGGFMEKFSIVLKRILPDNIYEKLLMNHYKLK